MKMALLTEEEIIDKTVSDTESEEDVEDVDNQESDEKMRLVKLVKREEAAVNVLPHV